MNCWCAAEHVECGAHTTRQCCRLARAVVMEKNHYRRTACHVVVDCHDVQAVGAQRLEYRSHLVLEHRHIAGDGSIGVGPSERAHVFRPIRALIAAPCS